MWKRAYKSWIEPYIEEYKPHVNQSYKTFMIVNREIWKRTMAYKSYRVPQHSP
jgi:hypothetical protein